MFNAWYSAPESVPENVRSYQLPCEQNRYCEGGLAYYCGRPYCWPLPKAAIAREATINEYGANGESYYAIRAPGISTGDVIDIYFDEEGNEPFLYTTADLLNFMDWNCGFAQDGFNISGLWWNSSWLVITVTNGNWTIPGVTDPGLTAVGVMGFKIKASGGLV